MQLASACTNEYGLVQLDPGLAEVDDDINVQDNKARKFTHLDYECIVITDFTFQNMRNS